MTDYKDGQWHGWNGGMCPVHERDIVRVVFLGRGDQPKRKAGGLNWNDEDTPIVAFCVVEKYREPKTIWVNEYQSGGCAVFATEKSAKEWVSDGFGAGTTRIAVKYREVIE